MLHFFDEFCGAELCLFRMFLCTILFFFIKVIQVGAHSGRADIWKDRGMALRQEIVSSWSSTKEPTTTPSRSS